MGPTPWLRAASATLLHRLQPGLPPSDVQLPPRGHSRQRSANRDAGFNTGAEPCGTQAGQYQVSAAGSGACSLPHPHPFICFFSLLGHTQQCTESGLAPGSVLKDHSWRGAGDGTLFSRRQGQHLSHDTTFLTPPFFWFFNFFVLSINEMIWESRRNPGPRPCALCPAAASLPG